MDPNTGRLRALTPQDADLMGLMEKGQEEKKPKIMVVGEPPVDLSQAVFLNNRPELVGLERLPSELEGEAKEALAGKTETMVDLKGDSGLARWAKRKRKENKKKSKKKMAKKSRKINRKK